MENKRSVCCWGGAMHMVAITCNFGKVVVVFVVQSYGAASKSLNFITWVWGVLIFKDLKFCWFMAFWAIKFEAERDFLRGKVGDETGGFNGASSNEEALKRSVLRSFETKLSRESFERKFSKQNFKRSFWEEAFRRQFSEKPSSRKLWETSNESFDRKLITNNPEPGFIGNIWEKAFKTEF